jgi:transposase
MAELFWLNDAQWAAIVPLLPRLGGKPRVDDRRVISGILYRFREGLRWRAVPEVYGPRTTLFNRFNRWSQRGVWQSLFAALAACGDPPLEAMVDSTTVRAHRSAAGAKGGSKTSRSAARAVVAPPRSTHSAMPLVGSTLCC